MAVTGGDLVSRIQSMIQVQHRMRAREISNQLGMVVAKELSTHGAEAHAGEVFDLFRKARREFLDRQAGNTNDRQGLNNSGDDSFIIGDILYPEMAGWGNFNPQSIQLLYDKVRDELETQIRLFSQASTLKNHLLAVLRPFGDRHASIWAKSLGANSLQSLRAQARALSESSIRTQVDLENWRVKVWDNFASHLVVEETVPQANHSKTEGRPKRLPNIPPGLVGRTTARIYKQRWEYWFEANLAELLKFVSQDIGNKGVETLSAFQGSISQLQARLEGNEGTSGEPSSPIIKKSVSSFEATSGTEGAPADLIRSAGSASELSSRESSHLENLPGLSIQVSSSLDKKLVSERRWSGSVEPGLEIENWIRLLQRVWKQSSSMLEAKVSIDEKHGRFEFNLPAQSPEDLSASLRDALAPEALKPFASPGETS